MALSKSMELARLLQMCGHVQKFLSEVEEEFPTLYNTNGDELEGRPGGSVQLPPILGVISASALSFVMVATLLGPV